MNELYQLPENPIEPRWSSFENLNGIKGQGGMALYGRKGSPWKYMTPRETLVLADVQHTSGTVRRIWITLTRSPRVLRGFRIEMFWDGAKTPAVSVPFGDFFCHSFGQSLRFQNACFTSPEGRSFVCYIPMPFRTGMKIQLVGETEDFNHVYWDVDYTVGDVHDENMLYFHACWRRENYTTLRRDMVILPRVEGRGRFLGCHLGMRQHASTNNFWWGEGEVKAYLDGDTDYPTLCGTGTEDYIGTAYGQGLFDHLYQGNHYISKDRNAFGFYRFHIPDPIYFYKDAKITIQVMGGPSYTAMIEAMEKDPSLHFMKAGDGTEFYTLEELKADPKRAEVMERIDDWCACAYFYLDKPENGLPPLASAEERLSDLPAD